MSVKKKLLHVYYLLKHTCTEYIPKFPPGIQLLVFQFIKVSVAFQAWLEDHGRDFGHFINNKWVKPENRKKYENKNPSNGKFIPDLLVFFLHT